MPFEAEQHAVPLERLCCFLGICSIHPESNRGAEEYTEREEVCFASIQKAIEEQKNTLKEKKSALKKAEKEVASLEAKKAKADAKAAEEAKKAEAESVVERLLASGMSADEILEKLK